jgi:hypothetical protein
MSDDHEWVMRIMRAVTPLLPKGFVGQIELNCVNGTIGNVNIKQSFRDEQPKK